MPGNGWGPKWTDLAPPGSENASKFIFFIFLHHVLYFFYIFLYFFIFLHHVLVHYVRIGNCFSILDHQSVVTVHVTIKLGCPGVQSRREQSDWTVSGLGFEMLPESLLLITPCYTCLYDCQDLKSKLGVPNPGGGQFQDLKTNLGASARI